MELSPEQKAAINEQKQYCPFCKIVKGEIPASKFYEDAHCIAILDINPATSGHTLLIPKEHYPVFPFLPAKERDHLATLLPKLGAAMQKAMLTTGCEYFVANGAAAGQQTSHLLLHIFPNDSARFNQPKSTSDKLPALEAALIARFASPKDRLAQLLSSNPQLRELIVERPKDFAQQLASVPDLATLFKGVDIAALATQLSESETPHAKQMEDEAFLQFVRSKEKLRAMLVDDTDELAEAIATQPKLQRFFENTTIAAVSARYRALSGAKQNSPLPPEGQSNVEARRYV